MNKLKQYQEKRKLLDNVKFNSLSGNKTNHFYAYAGETEEHMDMKYQVWKKLRKAGYEVWCEVIFNSGIRMDILAFRDGIFTNYEILASETKEKFLAKIKNYPDVNIVPIKSQKDIKNLELL